MLVDVPVDFAFADPAIVESSGLVVEHGLFVTANDSGDRGRIFTVDPSGATVGVTSWSLPATDVEALAPAGPGEVWVGDIGDNTASRPSVTLLRVPSGPGDRTVTPPAYSLVYPDGAHDAEALLAAPDGRLLVVTKEFLGGAVYATPTQLSPSEPNELEKVGRTMGFVTDGAFFPDGRHYVLRDYGGAAVYTYPGNHRVASFRLPDQRQGEGIAVDAQGWVHVSSEGEHSEVLRVVSVSVWGWLEGFVHRVVGLLTGHGAAA
ncbi:MAG TPA: hypothetical protein VFT70_14000 [Nocardioides sp.]|nr:hypothetical protein [Nocardioides sp.]